MHKLYVGQEQKKHNHYISLKAKNTRMWRVTHAHSVFVITHAQKHAHTFLGHARIWRTLCVRNMHTLIPHTVLS